MPSVDPKADPIPSLRPSMLSSFRRIMTWMGLFAIVIAGIAVLLVARGDAGVHVHMLIATGLGVLLTVLLATGLMTLVFLSSSSGHDEQAGGSVANEEEP